MQNIVIKKDVEVPNTPLFKTGQKVRVSDKIADALVSRKLAKYDVDKDAKTVKAKEYKAKKITKDPTEK